MKRFTIIERSYLERGKGGYFNASKEVEYLVDYTNLKINKLLDEKNKNMRKNYWKIAKDYTLKTKIGKSQYLSDLVENVENAKRYGRYTTDEKDLKDYAKEIIESL